MESSYGKNEYFGIDIGDGETAVAYMIQGSSNPTKVLELQGEKNMLTALASARDGTKYIGEAARSMNADINSLRIRFKSELLANPDAWQWMEQFAVALRERIVKSGQMLTLDRVYVNLGCPSGWDDTTREKHRRLLERAGFPNVITTSESRAAMVSAKDDGSLRLTMDELTKPLLIVDSGSSTTDFTYESNGEALDWGEVKLGGGLIDEMLLEHNLQSGTFDEQAKLQIQSNPHLNSKAELIARKVKEEYFNQKNRGEAVLNPVSLGERLYLDPPVHFFIECDDRAMDQILNQPCQKLQGISYLKAYESALRDFKKKMMEEPEVVLLTGGSSRMNFIWAIAQKVFPNARIVRGQMPEYSIALGLCSVLSTDQNTLSFLEAVRKMIKSSVVEDVVASQLPGLFERISPLLVDLMINKLLPAAFSQWQSGQLETLDDFSTAIQERTKTLLAHPEAQEMLMPEIAKWLQSLRPQLEDITTPLCLENGVQPTILKLPNFINIETGMPFPMESLLNLGPIYAVINVVVAIVIAVLCGGAGTALIMAGPLGWVLGGIIALVALVFGEAADTKAIMSSNLPLLFRKALSLQSLKGKLSKGQSEAADKIVLDVQSKIQNRDEEIIEMIDSISRAIEAQLTDQMQKGLLHRA